MKKMLPCGLLDSVALAARATLWRASVFHWRRGRTLLENENAGPSEVQMLQMTLWRFLKHGDVLEQLFKIGNLLQSELENHLCFMCKSTIPEVIFYLPEGNGWIGIFERIFTVILSIKYGQPNAKHP